MRRSQTLLQILSPPIPSQQQQSSQQCQRIQKPTVLGKQKENKKDSNEQMQCNSDCLEQYQNVQINKSNEGIDYYNKLNSSEIKQISLIRKNQALLNRNMSEFQLNQLVKMQKQILSNDINQSSLIHNNSIHQNNNNNKNNNNHDDSINYNVSEDNNDIQFNLNNQYLLSKLNKKITPLTQSNIKKIQYSSYSSHQDKRNHTELDKNDYTIQSKINKEQTLGLDSKVRSVTEYQEREDQKWPGKYPLYSKNIDKINLSCKYLKFKQDCINQVDNSSQIYNQKKSIMNTDQIYHQLQQQQQYNQQQPFKLSQQNQSFIHEQQNSIQSQQQSLQDQSLQIKQYQIQQQNTEDQHSSPSNNIKSILDKSNNKPTRFNSLNSVQTTQFNSTTRKLGTAQFQTDFTNQDTQQEQKLLNIKKNLYNQLLLQKMQATQNKTDTSFSQQNQNKNKSPTQKQNKKQGNLIKQKYHTIRNNNQENNEQFQNQQYKLQIISLPKLNETIKQQKNQQNHDKNIGMQTDEDYYLSSPGEYDDGNDDNAILNRRTDKFNSIKQIQIHKKNNQKFTKTNKQKQLRQTKSLTHYNNNNYNSNNNINLYQAQDSFTYDQQQKQEQQQNEPMIQYINSLKKLNNNIQTQLQKQLSLTQPTLRHLIQKNKDKLINQQNGIQNKKNKSNNNNNNNIIPFLNQSESPFYNISYYKIDMQTNNLERIHKNPNYTLHQELNESLQTNNHNNHDQQYSSPLLPIIQSLQTKHNRQSSLNLNSSISDNINNLNSNNNNNKNNISVKECLPESKQIQKQNQNSQQIQNEQQQQKLDNKQNKIEQITMLKKQKEIMNSQINQNQNNQNLRYNSNQKMIKNNEIEQIQKNQKIQENKIIQNKSQISNELKLFNQSNQYQNLQSTQNQIDLIQNQQQQLKSDINKIQQESNKMYKQKQIQQKQYKSKTEPYEIIDEEEDHNNNNNNNYSFNQLINQQFNGEFNDSLYQEHIIKNIFHKDTNQSNHHSNIINSNKNHIISLL